MFLSPHWCPWPAVNIETGPKVSVLQRCGVMDQNGVGAFERRDDEINWLHDRTHSLSCLMKLNKSNFLLLFVT